MFSSSGFFDRSAYLALSLLERPHSLQPLQLLQTPVGGEDKPMYLFVHLVVQPGGSLDGIPGKERVRKPSCSETYAFGDNLAKKAQLGSWPPFRRTQMEHSKEVHSQSRNRTCWE